MFRKTEPVERSERGEPGQALQARSGEGRGEAAMAGESARMGATQGTGPRPRPALRPAGASGAGASGAVRSSGVEESSLQAQGTGLAGSTLGRSADTFKKADLGDDGGVLLAGDRDRDAAEAFQADGRAAAAPAAPAAAPLAGGGDCDGVQGARSDHAVVAGDQERGAGGAWRSVASAVMSPTTLPPLLLGAHALLAPVTRRSLVGAPWPSLRGSRRPRPSQAKGSELGSGFGTLWLPQPLASPGVGASACEPRRVPCSTAGRRQGAVREPPPCPRQAA